MKTLPAALLIVLAVGCKPAGDKADNAPDTVAIPTPAPPADTVSLPFTYKDLVRLDHPTPGDPVQSPLTVEGAARGTWYFEASFPVILLGANGDTLAVTPAQAQGEWMTQNYVPFKVTLSFTNPGDSGTLILQKDNPSGLPEHDDQVRIPVRFQAQ